MTQEARYGRVPRSLWDEVPFTRLDDGGKLLALMLYTGPCTHSTGLFRVTMPALAGDLGWTSQTIERQLGAVIAAGVAWHHPETRTLCVPSVPRQFPPVNPSVLSFWIRHGLTFPPSWVRGAWAQVVRGAVKEDWREPLGVFDGDPVDRPDPPPPVRVLPGLEAAMAVRTAPAATKVADKTADIMAAMTGWHEITGQALKSASHRGFASGRLGEGHAVADLLMVVQWALAAPEAAYLRGESGDARPSYIRTSTLWSPSKFEGYLVQARRWLEGGEPGSSAEEAVREANTRAALERGRVASTLVPEAPLPNPDDA